MPKRIANSDRYSKLPITREIWWESLEALDATGTLLTEVGTVNTGVGVNWQTVTVGADNAEGAFHLGSGACGGFDNFYHAIGRFRLPSGDVAAGEQIMYFGFMPSANAGTAIVDDTGAMLDTEDFAGIRVDTNLDIVCHGIDEQVISNHNLSQDQDFLIDIGCSVDSSGVAQIGFAVDTAGTNNLLAMYRKNSVPAEQRIQFKDKTWVSGMSLVLGIKSLDGDDDPAGCDFNFFGASWNRP